MAEVKNTFIQSKMNQDLDGRILPNGQYRFGKNISISRSDAADVGALENVLGTELLTGFGLDDCAYKIIGHFVDFTNDRIFLFITDYTDNSTNTLDNNITGQNSALGYDNKNCFIALFNDRTKIGSLLVGGDFLNFSKNYPITGINLLEDLLFWTDNRNQPRKINVKTAFENPFVLGSSPGYYTNEDHISVAKYYPFECISLLNNIGTAEQWVTTMTNKSEPFLPAHCVAEVGVAMGAPGNICDLSGTYNNIQVGYELSAVDVADGILIDAVTPDFPIVGQTRIEWSALKPLQFDINDLIYFKAPNPDYDAAWPGDKVFLEDKFVRFSYRFQFDDGEYSLTAPFTQACFIPKQDGYFIGNKVKNSTPPPYAGGAPSKTLIGDEGAAYSSSIVEFFENKVQDIGLYIPSAWVDEELIPFNQLQDQLKVNAIEIIYKESESTTAYVLDTIDAEDFNPITTQYYKYDYQSRKPWKTLREREITRVYDKVPIRALAQESSGNRIIYGNYVDKHTSPETLTYSVSIAPKIPVPVPGDPNFGNKDDYIRKEYQNHTVKQNRTYQVGVVLSDRYGRQSDVILSDVFDEAVQGFGSTIYHPYRDTESTLIDTTDTWPGDQIAVTWFDTIPEIINKVGYPGIYSNNNGKLQSLIPGTSSGWAPGCLYCWTATGVSSGATATFTADVTLAGEIDPSTIIITSSTTGWQESEPVTIGDTCGCPVGVYSDWKASALINQNTLGWYSWKIVIKQTEQDYYNCYLPGMLAGYPKNIIGTSASQDLATGVEVEGTDGIAFPQGNEKDIAHITLINDNINKIPRDLSQVGPTQKIFGSSVQLFGRVENSLLDNGGVYNTYNKQTDPGIIADTVVTIGTVTDLNLGSLSQAGAFNRGIDPFSYPTIQSLLIPIYFYNGESNPLVARLSTNKKIGVENVSPAGPITLGMVPYLSVYETKPVTSNLDIYWETSTSGLVTELNHSILTEDNTLPVDITDPSIDLVESDPPGSIISTTFSAVSANGSVLNNLVDGTTVELASVVTGDGVDITYKFELRGPDSLPPVVAGENVYEIKTADDPNGYFVCWNSETKRTYTFTFKILRAGTILTLPVDFNVTREIKVQNDIPDQIGMYDTGGGNNARTDICNSAYGQINKFYNSSSVCAPGPGEQNPIAVVVGDWQKINPWLGNSDNIYYTTFGDSFTSLCYSDTNDGIRSYKPTFPGEDDINNVIPGAGVSAATAYADIGGPDIFPTLPLYLNSGVSMVNRPGAPIPAWDGLFKCFNGAYGTTFGTPFPINPNIGDEIVYSISRAYQVSAFFPWQTGALVGCGQIRFQIGEVVFANGALVGGLPSPLISMLPDQYAAPNPTTKVNWNGWSSGTTTVPTGPIYRDFASGNIPDPCDFNGPAQGESIVGERYNIPNTGHTHYWEGLANCAATDPSLLTLQTPGPGVSPMPNPTNKAGFWYVNEVSWVTQSGLDILSLGLAQATGINNNIVPNFHMVTAPPPSPYEPTVGAIATDPDTPIPPGRYVVTVRATDKSVTLPSGDGLYFEWDVPIQINGPFCSNYGSIWGNQNGFSKFLPSYVDTYPWKNL